MKNELKRSTTGYFHSYGNYILFDARCGKEGKDVSISPERGVILRRKRKCTVRWLVPHHHRSAEENKMAIKSSKSSSPVKNDKKLTALLSVFLINTHRQRRLIMALP
jgi:hypothetical protein